MQPHNHGALLITRLLAAISLLILLTGCGTTSGAATNAAISCATPTPGVQQPTGSSLLAFNAPAAVDMDCLHIQTQGIDCGSEVLLNGVRPTYDQGTIDQIDNYLAAYVKATQTEMKPYTAALAAQLPPVPDTLQVVPGAGSHFPGKMLCSGVLDITNTGNQTIQIPSVGLTLTKGAVENPFAYQLIDGCTLPNQAGCCHDCGSSPGCGFYVNLDLQGDPTGTHLNGEIENAPAENGCPQTLMLRPHQLGEVALFIDSTPPNLIYQEVELTLSVNSGKGSPTILTLPPSFTSTLVFADLNSQFTCYGFDGTTFTKEPQIEVDGGNCI